MTREDSATTSLLEEEILTVPSSSSTMGNVNDFSEEEDHRKRLGAVK